MIKISPSILSADFAQLRDAVERLEANGADYIHCDVMDGSFVPEITFGAKAIRDIHQYTSLGLQVHLMIEQPQRHIDKFIAAGAYSVTVHVENCPNLQQVLDEIKSKGVRSGVAINPETDPALLENIVADEILVMTVQPGYGGQGFIHEAADKIRVIKENLIARKLDTVISVDGGINAQTAGICIEKGVDILVSGNYIFTSPDFRQAMDSLRG